MAATTPGFKAIAGSKPFLFVVGEEAQEFFLHQTLVCQHSKPLGALMNGRMSEAKAGCAIIDDVSSSTFARFAEYVYRGDYQAEEPSVVLDHTTVGLERSPETVQPAIETAQPAIETVQLAIETDIPEESDVFSGQTQSEVEPGWGWGSTSHNGNFGYRPAYHIKKKDKVWDSSQMKVTKAWPLFQARKYNFEPVKTHGEPTSNKDLCEDYSEVFLSHAQVYVFADKYDVQNLKHLALNKLHKTLSVFQLSRNRAVDVALLMKYTYANTASREVVEDELRALVIHYVSCKVEKLLDDQTFRDVMKAENESSLDLLECLKDRLD